MDTAIALFSAAAWLALGVLLAYHVVDIWRRGERAPFFQVLERHGLSATQAEQKLGGEAIACALRRCAQCADRKACARVLAVDWLGKQPPACQPNARFFEQVKGA